MENRKRERMRMRHLKGLVIGLTALLFSIPASSQTLELGLFGGGSYYLGELNTAIHFNETQLAYGAVARFNFNPRWALKGSFYRGKLKGDDNSGALYNDRGLNFATTINDISVVAEFHFWEYFTGSKRNFFTPFIFAGVGFFTFNPESQDGVALQPLGTEGQNEGFDGRSPYNKWGISIPFGFGFKWSVSERVGIGVEWGMRKTFSDYVDDVSTSYYLVGEDINPEIDAQYYADPTMNHQPGMQRGDDQTYDWFNYTGVTVTYKINLRSRLKCNLEGW
jgi:hypothetical protein